MFRGFVARFTNARFSGSGSLFQSVKWSSTRASPSLIQSSKEKIEEQPLQTEPLWVQSSLDKKIYSIQDWNSLIPTILSGNFDGRNAVNLVITVSRLITEGKMTVQDFQKLNQYSKIEEALEKGGFNVGIATTLMAIRNLLSLGFSTTSKGVESLLNDLLWQMRKIPLIKVFQVVEFHCNRKETDMQQKVMKEAVETIQRRWVEMTDAREFALLFKYSSHFPPNFLIKMEDELVTKIEFYTQEERTSILVALGTIQKRPKPLLRALTYHLNKNSEPFTVQTSSEILFALHRVSLHNHGLLERICNDLVVQITPEIKSSVIGSLFTNLGQLKYRHEGVFEALCGWVNQNWSQVRKQDVISLVLSLAAVDFLPSNWESLWAKISELLKEEIRTPTLNDTVLLNVTWSLAILNHLEPALAQLVLNDSFVAKNTHEDQGEDFLNKVIGTKASNINGVKLKLNQVWALAHLNKWQLKDLTKKMPLIMKRVVPSASSASVHKSLNQTVMDALENFVPKEKYLHRNGHTPLGVPFDAECILNDKCVALPLAEYKNDQNLPANAARIAFMVLDYKDLCMSKPNLTGVESLRERLLEMSGYRVVKVKHTEFDVKEKQVKQVQYLEQLIKDSALSKM